MSARQRVALLLAITATLGLLAALPVEWFAGVALCGSVLAFASMAVHYREDRDYHRGDAHWLRAELAITETQRKAAVADLRSEAAVIELISADRDQWSRRALRAEAAIGNTAAVPLLRSSDFAADVDQSLAIARHTSNADARLRSVPPQRDGGAS